MTSGLLDWCRDARWLTAERVQAYARIFVNVLVLAVIAYIAMSHDLVDPVGHPIGTDFLNVYAAGLLADRGNAAGAYDWPTHHAVEASVVAYDGYFGWHYPPMFLFVAAPLAFLGYAPALALYLALTFAAYLLAVMRLGRGIPGILWFAAGFPAVFVNLGHGQNGFLTTALLASGLATLTHRPVLAGIFLGCLAYKPQFAVLLPVALLAGGFWRSVLAAGVMALALALASLIVFGPDTWLAFFASLEPTRTIILEQGATGWEKIVSVFSAVRMLGGSIALAYAMQTAMTLSTTVGVALVWWRSKRPGPAIGCLALAIPLTTPYILDYDLVVLVVAVVALCRDRLEIGFGPWEKIALACVTIAPILARGIGSGLHVPIMPVILIGALALFAWRAVMRGLEKTTVFAILPE